MLRENHKIIVRFHRTADLLITSGCFIMAYFIKRNMLPANFSGLAADPNYYIVLLSIIILWYMSFNWFGLYRSIREYPFSWFFFNTIKACVVGLLFLNLLILSFLPVFILISMAIKIVSPGPVFYKQEHLGRNRRLFAVLKFRTMVIDADQKLEEL